MRKVLLPARSRILLPRDGAMRRALLVLGCVASLAGVASCRSGAEPPARPGPLVVIGADGVEWRLVLDMIEAGRLPRIAQLMKDGTFARLSTLSPALSPPIWTSMATGVVPSRHGILGFVQPKLPDAQDQPVLFTNRERRVKALWNIAEDAGLRSCVIGYWMTFPVESVRGVMVAQTGEPPGASSERRRKGALQEGVSGQVHPPEYEDHAFRLADSASSDLPSRERELFGNTKDWAPGMQRLVEHSRWSVAADSSYQRIALDVVRDAKLCDLILVYLGAPDVLGHRFWRWTYPGDFEQPPAEAEVALYGDVLRRTYAQLDSFVGEMRRAAGAHATVALVSDHGMGAFRPKASVDVTREDGELIRTGGHSAARDAFFAAAGPGVAKASSSRTADVPADAAGVPLAGSVLDMAPTLLALLDLPRGADMDGRVLSPLLDPTFVTAHPLREVPTHTPDGWAETRQLAPVVDPAAGERLEQLRGLGYLE